MFSEVRGILWKNIIVNHAGFFMRKSRNARFAGKLPKIRFG
jgi:hypothetical protein